MSLSEHRHPPRTRVSHQETSLPSNASALKLKCKGHFENFEKLYSSYHNWYGAESMGPFIKYLCPFHFMGSWFKCFGL